MNHNSTDLNNKLTAATTIPPENDSLYRISTLPAPLSQRQTPVTTTATSTNASSSPSSARTNNHINNNINNNNNELSVEQLNIKRTQWAAYSDATELVSKRGGAAMVFICSKAYDTVRAARVAAQVLSERGVVVTLQNGLGNYETIAQVLGGPERVIQGVTSHGAMLDAQGGDVFHNGVGDTGIARNPTLPDSAPAAASISRVAQVLGTAGFPARVLSNIDTLVWGKLIISAAINPLTALLRVPNGLLLDSPHLRVPFSQLLSEALRIAQAKQIELPYPDPFEAAWNVVQKTRTNHSSMCTDVLRGRPTEIEYINGK